MKLFEKMKKSNVQVQLMNGKHLNFYTQGHITQGQFYACYVKRVANKEFLEIFFRGGHQSINVPMHHVVAIDIQHVVKIPFFGYVRAFF